MLSIPFCLPLTVGALIQEDLITNEDIVELLTQRHLIASDWAVLMAENMIVAPPFLDDRHSCLNPAFTSSIIHLQKPRLLPVRSLFRHLTHPSLEYKVIVAKIDEIIVANEKRLRTTTSPPSIIDVANDGVAASVRSTSSTSSVVTEVNERMSLFYLHPFCFAS